MTAKQYLQNYRKLECDYKVALEEYRQVENDMISIKSPSFGDDKVQTSPKNDPIGEMVCNIEKRKAIIGVRMTTIQSKMTLIRNQVLSLEETDNDYYTILMMRYILYKEWKFICSTLHVSRTQANFLHGRALQEFDNKYSETLKD